MRARITFPSSVKPHHTHFEASGFSLQFTLHSIPQTKHIHTHTLKQDTNTTNQEMKYEDLQDNSVPSSPSTSSNKSHASPPLAPSLPSSSSSSSTVVVLDEPLCRICHMGVEGEGASVDKLISPCKCSGSMQYIHCGCLLKWLNVSNKTNEDKPLSCELCYYEYVWRKKFNFNEIKFPRCSLRDVCYHLIYIIALLIMLYSAISLIIHKDSHTTPSTDSSHLNPVIGRLADRRGHQRDRIVPAYCGLLFTSIIFAIFMQMKTKHSLHALIFKFISINQTYYITEYNHSQANDAIESTNDNKNRKYFTPTINECSAQKKNTDLACILSTI